MFFGRNKRITHAGQKRHRYSGGGWRVPLVLVGIAILTTLAMFNLKSLQSQVYQQQEDTKIVISSVVSQQLQQKQRATAKQREATSKQKPPLSSPKENSKKRPEAKKKGEEEKKKTPPIASITKIDEDAKKKDTSRKKKGVEDKEKTEDKKVVKKEVEGKKEVKDMKEVKEKEKKIASNKRRTVTETGVDLADPALYEAIDLKGDSSTASVMGMATGYDIRTYESFVGSLRKSGFKGQIFLGVAPDVSPQVLRYFRYRNVTAKVLQWVNCTYTTAKKGDIFKETTCAHPYPDIKIRWSRFPLIRDWLRECETCTGPVLVMDVRDSFFQLNPFGPGSLVIQGLQVYEEHKSQTTEHWITDQPIGDCKDIHYREPMLCSGTTSGTRAAMLKYLDIMYEEMKVWIDTEKCRFNMNGDDQSIHNYLYYSGQLPFATAVENRRGGIVNTVGVEGSIVFNAHKAEMKAQGREPSNPYPSASGRLWIGKEFNVSDEEGFFTEFDGSRSRVIHQYDRWGVPYTSWLSNQVQLVQDPVPSDFERGEPTRAADLQPILKASHEEKAGAEIKTKSAVTATVQNKGRPIVKATIPQSPSERRQRTDTGVDLTDPALYESIDLKGDSSTATVMGMASGYDVDTYQSFVGSLRKSGFKGHIILGVAPDVKRKSLDYLAYRNVTVKIMKWVSCTYKDDTKKGDIFKETKCADPYPDIKIRWSRFPLQRDWLEECKTCTGPVLVMDVRDSYFQLDPFGPGSPVITGLQVYEEHKSQTTQHWLTEWPIGDCKGLTYDETMLCSGTTSGTRAAMLKYLEIMYEEMKVWINDLKCRFDINGDDQSIHNYLFYSGQLPFATAIVNRAGGIVNTAGVEGAKIRKAHKIEMMELYNVSEKEANFIPYKGATENVWIGTQYNVTDEAGFFTEFDGSLSRVIHQFERFGPQIMRWVEKQDFFVDKIEKVKPPIVTDNGRPPIVNASIPQSPSERRQQTDTGVDLTDPSLYESIDLKGDSSTATVMGMATGFGLETYESFVGSLRKSGFKGNIILGVDSSISKRILKYFAYRNVTAKIMKYVDCTYRDDTKKVDIFKETKCADPYPDIKIRWSRFPLQRDWLEECKTCTGPVLVMDVRDSVFQRDPFGAGSPGIQGLQVYEEHKSQTTQHWLTEWPIGDCKGFSYDETMLCSGTTTGTRAAMLKYLEIMYEEMKVWINDPKCRFDVNGDDQSIHNYLYYSGQLPFATAIPNRGGGIVHTVGKEGAVLREAKEKKLEKDKNMSHEEAVNAPFEGASGKRWIGAEFNLTDDEGFFTEFDGSRSRVIHQYDRFAEGYIDQWLEKQSFYHDHMPEEAIPTNRVESNNSSTAAQQ